MLIKTGAITLAVAAALVASGCASKKFVNARVDPLNQRVGQLETTTSGHGEDIGELQRQVSLADERAITADAKAAAAGEAAAVAGRQAKEADGKADNAQRSADQALTGVERLSSRIDGLHDYEFVWQETVLFDFESSRLTEEAKEKLDAAATRLEMNSPYVIEVQGFTDTTGSNAYNLRLSQSRADAVVRYLTADLNVPLHRIHMIGLGSIDPAADNKTREGRKMNRRVEMRLFVADQPALSADMR